jgi:hypothetical protein
MNAERTALPRKRISNHSPNPMCLTGPIGVRSAECAPVKNQSSHLYDSFLAERGILPRSESANEILMEWNAA